MSYDLCRDTVIASSWTHDLCAKPFEAGRELLQNLTIEAASGYSVHDR
jgi:hypothetical protein